MPDHVALLAEGVDRNWLVVRVGGVICVALLAEGVDRNGFVAIVAEKAILSPSSRRAWIEITRRRTSKSWWSVALLAEGVDRNTVDEDFYALYFVCIL